MRQPTCRSRVLANLAACALALATCALAACSARMAPGPGATAPPAAACLPGERGYLRASLRGAIGAELDWRGAALQCEGGARPDGRGVRVSFLGPPDARGQRLRIVFGVAARAGAGITRNAPTNVTVIVEGRQRLYATQGDERCTVESLVQEPVPATAPPSPGAMLPYRIAARGYCIDPAMTLDGSARLYINRFDFAGVARFEDNELHAPANHS